MNPYLAYALGALTVVVSQILHEVIRGLAAGYRSRNQSPIQQRAVDAIRGGEVVEVTQHFDVDGRETVIRLSAPARSTGHEVRG